MHEPSHDKSPLRACSWGYELTLHTVVLVNIGKINTFDREISSLAPTVRALELNYSFISKRCLALHSILSVMIFI